MKIIPTWPIAAGALVIGLGVGVGADHLYMNAKVSGLTKDIATLKSNHAEELRVREVKRGNDERAARDKERALSARVGEIEQEKVNEIATIRAGYNAELVRVQNRAARKPAGTSPAAAPSPACQGSTGAELSREDAIFLAGEAARADEHRAALSACYKAYDAVALPPG